jgi:hypothetical protein
LPEPVKPPQTPPKKEPRAKLGDVLKGFDRFWEAYPEKKGKLAALASWKKINPSDELIDKVIKAVEQQKWWKRWQDGFIPNPATWLNQGRWDDEESGKVKPKVPQLSQEEYLKQLADQRKRYKEEEAELMRRRVEKVEGQLQAAKPQPETVEIEVAEEDRELFEAFMDEG